MPKDFGNFEREIFNYNIKFILVTLIMKGLGIDQRQNLIAINVETKMSYIMVIAINLVSMDSTTMKNIVIEMTIKKDHVHRGYLLFLYY